MDGWAAAGREHELHDAVVSTADCKRISCRALTFTLMALRFRNATATAMKSASPKIKVGG